MLPATALIALKKKAMQRAIPRELFGTQWHSDPSHASAAAAAAHAALHKNHKGFFDILNRKSVVNSMSRAGDTQANGGKFLARAQIAGR